MTVGEAKIPPPRNVLTSFFYYQKVDLDKLAHCRIIADSGAFSWKMATASFRSSEQTLTTQRLVAWVKKWEHRLSWAASIDIGDAQQTRNNWQRMVDLGIPGISTLHYGDTPDDMDWYVEQGVDFLGLGGLAGANTSPNDQLRWLIKMFRHAEQNHPQMRFHGWGVTNASMMRLPFYSVDSSSWGSSYRYGRITVRDPQTGEKFAIRLDGTGKSFDRKTSRVLLDYYGVSPSDIDKAGPNNRTLLVRISALSASVQEQEWRRKFRRHPISAPQWGRLKGWNLTTGPNQHLALGGCGAGIRDRKVFENFDYGPHMHLVDGYPPHLQVINDLNRSLQA